MLDLGIRRSHLYSALRVAAHLHNDRTGDDKVSHGTGFFSGTPLPARPEAFCVAVVTNRHVVDPGAYKAGFAGYRLVRLDVSFEQVIEGAVVRRTGSWRVDADKVMFHTGVRVEDVALIAVPTSDEYFDSATPPSKHKLNVRYPSERIATQADFGDEVGPGDFVVSTGYPRLLGGQVESPLIVPGLISSDPAEPYAVDQHGEGRIFLVHAFSREGMSGAPVFAVQRGVQWGESPTVRITGFEFRRACLVGVNAGRVQDEDGPTALSYAVRSDVILELLNAMANAATPPRIS